MSQDHYSALGVPRTATESDIKKAYLANARIFHPDRCQKEAEIGSGSFYAIQNAWETLGDPKKRACYDAALSSTLTSAATSERGNSSSTHTQMDASAWAEVTLSDMARLDDQDSGEVYYVYDCRCGDTYEISDDELRANESAVYIPCGGCSLQIRLEATPKVV